MVANARNCPACGNSVSQEYVGIAETIPQIPGVAPARPAADTIPCPMCSEPIPRSSTRCKWCGENIGSGKPTGMGAQNYQPPQPQPGYMPPPAGVQRPDPNPALIVSIIALAGGFFSCGFLHLLGPVGWMMSNTYVNKCRAMGLEPEGSGTTAKVLSIISTVFLILGLCGVAAYIGLVMLAVGGAAASH